MIIPEFLKQNDTIGITACSSGILDKVDRYEKSVAHFHKKGFSIIETNNVRTSGVVSSSSQVRANELDELVTNKEVKMISMASGGDFLYDMLPLVNFDNIKNNPKWIAGSSDPTSLLFTITTKYDIATIYTPCNMSGFDDEYLHPSLETYFEIIKGNLKPQIKFDKCEFPSFSNEFIKDDIWLNLNGDVNEIGMLIGGCMECLKDVIGTKFDCVSSFLEKYKENGFIWYFDIFSMSAEGVYNTLLQFRNAGWFQYTKAILIGRVAFEKTFVDMSYEELIQKALPTTKVIFNMDLGHVKPSFTLINGMMATIVSNESQHELIIHK